MASYFLVLARQEVSKKQGAPMPWPAAPRLDHNRQRATTKDGGNADNVWNNYLPPIGLIHDPMG